MPERTSETTREGVVDIVAGTEAYHCRIKEGGDEIGHGTSFTSAEEAERKASEQAEQYDEDHDDDDDE